MNKKGFVFGIPPQIFILLAVAIGIFFFLSSSNFLSIGFDDFLIEDDFIAPNSPVISSNTPNNYCTQTVHSNIASDFFCEDDAWSHFTERRECTSQSGGGPYNAEVYIIGEALRIGGTSNCGSSANAKVTYKKNLKNNDIKIRYTHSSEDTRTGSGGSFVTKLNNQEAFVSDKRGSISYLVEMLLDIEDPNTYHVFANGEKVKTITINEPEVILNFETRGVTSIGSSTAFLDYVKSRPYFNCEVDTDEVVVRDIFLEETTFNIDDLSFPPKKFCVDSFPAIKRSFTDTGVRADIQGQITKKLVTGQDIIVGSGESILIFYIADYQEGMVERCSIDEAYDTSTNKCVKIIEEEEDIVEFINDKEFIIVGKNSIFFENSLDIGTEKIVSSKPRYLCAEEDDKANAPDPRESCWNVDVTFAGITKAFIPGREQNINNFFSLTVHPEATYDGGKVENDYTNNFVLKVRNDGVFNIDTVDDSEDSYFVKFQSSKKIEFEVMNNFADFTSQQSGVQVEIRKGLLTQQERKIIPLAFNKGVNKYSVTLDTGEFGEVLYEITPFYKIGDDVIFDNEKIVRNFEVVSQIPEDTVVVDHVQGETGTEPTVITKTVFVERERQSLFARFWQWLKNLFGIGG